MISLVMLMQSMTLPMLGAITLGVLGQLAAIFVPVSGALILYNTLHNLSIQPYLILLVVSGISRGFLRYGEQALNHYIAFKLLAQIRHRVFKKLRTLAPAKLDEKDRGELIATLTKDVELLEVFYAHTLSPIAIAILVSIVMVAVIYHFVGSTVLISIISFVLVGLVIPAFVYRYGSDAANKKRNLTSEMNARILEMNEGYDTVIEYHAQNKYLNQIGKLNNDLHHSQKKISSLMGLNRSLTEVCIIGFALIYIIVSKSGDLSSLFVAVVAHLSSFGPLIALSNLSSDLVHTFAAGRRVLDLLDEEAVIHEYGDEVIEEKSSVIVDDISFGYQAEDILSGLNVQFEDGTIYGIQGPSGSGKSTLLKLLMRYWDVRKGSIAFNETTIQEISNESLRSYESSMSQTSDIFSTTIFDNIACVKEDASLEDVKNAAKKASIHDFIESLPQGYQTKVDKKSTFLSAGERQRLALARMFCHDGNIFILDEPTSNIDSLNEAMILKALYEARHGKLMILVSHRPSTLMIADTKYYMKQGKLTL